MQKARAKRQRKIGTQKQNTIEEQPLEAITIQVQEVAVVAAEKVTELVKTAGEAVKKAVTVKRSR